MLLELPEDCRPTGRYYRKCELGIDLPYGFYDDLKGVDENLFPVWHAYSLLWEQIITNGYKGALEDPRWEINFAHGELNFGYPVKHSTTDRPLTNPEVQQGGMWHIWRLARPHGWCHIVALESKDPEYLKMVVHRLHIQGKYNDKYGHMGYAEYLNDLDEEKRAKEMKDKEDLMADIHDANRWFFDKAAENFERGKTAPTNPMKETISSFGGQTDHSRLERPLDDSDKESGLILPEGY